MTTLEDRAVQLRPHILIEELITRHGIWHVLRALVKAMTARRKRTRVTGLSNYIRRDVGLAPDHPPPTLRHLHY